MSDREAFESAVRATWSDCYPFTRDKDGEYRENKLDGMWWGWQASRQAIEGEPVMWSLQFDSGPINHFTTYPTLEKAEDYVALCSIGKDKSNIKIIPLYTHPASANVPEKWRTVMKELADDLESEIEARRSGDLDRRIERDLIVVKEARVLLDEQEQGQ